MLSTNTIRYGTDNFVFDKIGLITSAIPIDCAALTGIDGFVVASYIPANCNAGIIFKIGNSWQKLTVSNGTGTLVNVTTQMITADSVLAEGNIIADLAAITNIPGFVGKQIYIAIALTAPSDSTDMPSLQLSIKGHSTSSQNTTTVTSPPIALASTDVELIDLQAQTAVTDGATAAVSVLLRQSGTWSAPMTLTQARRKKASEIQFQATFNVATIGTGSARVAKATAIYRSNDATVSGKTAEIISVTEDFINEMRYGRLMVKHQRLRDAGIAAYISMRDVPKTRDRIAIGVGSNGQRLTLTLGVKDAEGNIVPDSGVNHSTIRVWYGSKQVFDFDYNTQIADTGVVQLSQISVTPDDGVTVFASYKYGWQPEVWEKMTAGATQKYDDTMDSTTFSYVLPSASEGKGVSDVKIVLDKPGGHVAAEALGTATGKTQMLVLAHAAKTASIVVSASIGIAQWSYDYDSRILTVVAPKDATLTVAYDWVAETPVVRGFVAAWSE
ncbi:MAG TPA: hypothetical protein PKA28_10900 [Methylomusa anaerophila]|uniref:Uncharacterized protein n=1 Tax=Methylomusa anaerophila TaxID=1930071 RepID=A0A348AJ20_9FIRM|nr:hypothetical protein [Methylomusa anaerophila]BBB91068.1 hypothetical protein MAMMFC1_01736 [Methylomusa anaerophila]HML88943.1 hypothetical protein [Methylomusa anaerophila]